MYINNLVNNKPELMKKLHKVMYSDFFADNFDSKQIDDRFDEMTVDERLRIVDHIIDYVYVDFKALTA